ncbi:hypothetical protein AB0D04_01915 [Streptomyces sp. NPDC048483]|uniref:hypothetical protein n=1 Tax=Streptomyces sp. NPDC048483 TaxID=3154927 RepID=UPI00342BC6B5
MLKHYYRLVYWKRRITWALGWRSGGQGAGLRSHPRTYGRRAPRRGRQLVHGARPLLVFGVLVAIVVALSALSALLAWADDPFGPEGLGVGQPAGSIEQGAEAARHSALRTASAQCGQEDWALV